MDKKENVLISMCALGIPCQYHGARAYRRQIIDDYILKYNLVPVCPEQLGGLPTPRPACKLVRGRVIGGNGLDYTKEYDHGAKLALQICNAFGAKKAYLKKNSPSCGKDGKTTRYLKKHGITVCQV